MIFFSLFFFFFLLSFFFSFSPWFWFLGCMWRVGKIHKLCWTQWKQYVCWKNIEIILESVKERVFLRQFNKQQLLVKTLFIKLLNSNFTFWCIQTDTRWFRRSKNLKINFYVKKLKSPNSKMLYLLLLLLLCQ